MQYSIDASCISTCVRVCLSVNLKVNSHCLSRGNSMHRQIALCRAVWIGYDALTNNTVSIGSCVCLCVCVCVVQLTATRARLTTEDVASTPTALRTNTEIATAYVIRAILETASIAILLVIAVPSWPIIIQLHSRPLKGGRPGARHFSVGRAMSFLTANTARLEGPSRFSDSQHNIADQIFS